MEDLEQIPPPDDCACCSPDMRYTLFCVLPPMYNESSDAPSKQGASIMLIAAAIQILVPFAYQMTELFIYHAVLFGPVSLFSLGYVTLGAFEH